MGKGEGNFMDEVDAFDLSPIVCSERQNMDHY